MSARRPSPAPSKPALPRPEQLGALYDELLSLPNVKGCYVGFKCRDGQPTRDISIVACVEAKVPTRQLKRSHRVPRQLAWKATSRRSGKIASDVRIIGKSNLHAAVLGAGDAVQNITSPGQPSRPTDGTIGAAMLHPVFGKVVTTAGHVLPIPAPSTIVFTPGHEPQVRLTNAGTGAPFVGLARKVSITTDADYLLVSPPDGMAAENLYQDDQPLALPFAPGPGDIGSRVFVLAKNEMRATCLLGIHGAMQIGRFFLRDLLLTPVRTIGGDSGACLVNAESRLMGFVEGVTALDGELISAYTAAAWPFVRENGVFF